MWQDSDFLEHAAGLRGTSECETHTQKHTHAMAVVSVSQCVSHTLAMLPLDFITAASTALYLIFQTTVLYDSVAHMHIYSHMCKLYVHTHSLANTNTLVSVAKYALINKI